MESTDLATNLAPALAHFVEENEIRLAARQQFDFVSAHRFGGRKKRRRNWQGGMLLCAVSPFHAHVKEGAWKVRDLAARTGCSYDVYRNRGWNFSGIRNEPARKNGNPIGAGKVAGSLALNARHFVLFLKTFYHRLCNMYIP